MWAYLWAFARAGLRPVRLEYAQGPAELAQRNIAGQAAARAAALPATLWALNAYAYSGLTPLRATPVGFAAVAVIVQKYGGTSVAGPEEIKRVARRIVATAEDGQPRLRRRLGDGAHDRRADRPRRAGLADGRTRASWTCS